MKVSSCVSSTW